MRARRNATTPTGAHASDAAPPVRAVDPLAIRGAIMSCLAVPPSNPPVAAPLRILMLAPEPFFEPRGTPFSEYHRIKALVEDGHQVDLVTYGYGADVALPNLRIIRSRRLPFVRRVPIGPSVIKLLLDVALTMTTIWHAPGPPVRRGALARRGGPARRRARAAGSACRTSTTCTRACRSSSPTSASRKSGARASRVRGDGAADDRRIARHHHHLPGAAGHGGGRWARAIGPS